MIVLLVVGCTDEVKSPKGGGDEPNPAAGPVAQPSGKGWWSETHLYRANQAGAPMVCGVGRGSSTNVAFARTKAAAQARVNTLKFLQNSIYTEQENLQGTARSFWWVVDIHIEGLKTIEHHREGRDSFVLTCVDIAALSEQQGPWSGNPEFIAGLKTRAKKALSE